MATDESTPIPTDAHRPDVTQQLAREGAAEARRLCAHRPDVTQQLAREGAAEARRLCAHAGRLLSLCDGLTREVAALGMACAQHADSANALARRLGGEKQA